MIAKFTRDVESATLEVHVLTPTRYEAPCGDRIKNQEASTRNEGVLYKFGALKDMDEDKEWRWEIIDSLIAHRKHSGERSIFLCEHHIEQVFEPGRKWQSLPCSKCRKNEPRPVVNTRIVYSE